MTRIFGGILLFLAAWIGSEAADAQGSVRMLLWPAISLFMVGSAYALRQPAILGKLPSGKIRPVSWFFGGPYFVLIFLTWKSTQMLSSSTSRISKLYGNLYLGPRLSQAHDLSDQIQTVCDLTSEFQEPTSIISNYHYISFPILDAGAPLPTKLLELCQRLDQSPPSLYIHCAQGFGRTGLVASALLLFRGLAPSPEDALQQVRAARPGVRLNREQRQCLRKFHQFLVNQQTET